MRVLITNQNGLSVVKELKEAIITTDMNLAFPELSKKYITGESSRSLLNDLLINGWADLRSFKSQRFNINILL